MYFLYLEERREIERSRETFRRWMDPASIQHQPRLKPFDRGLKRGRHAHWIASRHSQRPILDTRPPPPLPPPPSLLSAVQIAKTTRGRK